MPGCHRRAGGGPGTLRSALDSRLRGNDTMSHFALPLSSARAEERMAVMDRQAGTYRHGGVTLVELLVAVSITVGMLLIAGMVFTSSTTASGRATANEAIIGDLRALTHQLETDLAGIRPDMPMAIIFELDPDDPCFLIRQDRIVFFANGNFQVYDPCTASSVHGNAACIYYGQSDEGYSTAAHDNDVYDPCKYSPFRRILTRRANMVTPDSGAGWASYRPTVGSPAKRDYFPFAWYTSLAAWKTVPLAEFETDYYDETTTWSWIRRVDVGGMAEYVPEADRSQRLYLLEDVTDFKIEVWFAGANRWFPDLQEFDINDDDDDQRFACNWGPPGATDWDDWYYCPWPQALRFTFTLYDHDRRHYPEGQTYSYIVELPRR